MTDAKEPLHFIFYRTIEERLWGDNRSIQVPLLFTLNSAKTTREVYRKHATKNTKPHC